MCRHRIFSQSVLLQKRQWMCIFFDRRNTKVFRGRKNVQAQNFFAISFVAKIGAGACFLCPEGVLRYFEWAKKRADALIFRNKIFATINSHPIGWLLFVSVGNDLSSRAVTHQVFSARLSLTTVFGMGTGGPSTPSTPTIYKRIYRL